MNLNPPKLLCHRTNILLNLKRTKFRLPRRFYELKDREESDYFSANEPNPVSDIEKKVEESKSRLKWRPQRKREGTLWGDALRFLAPERTKAIFDTLRQPMDRKSIKTRVELRLENINVFQQRFNPDRHRILGNDLAIAHFVIARGGQVRFTQSPQWMKKNKNDKYDLPNLFNSEYLVDAVKCEGMDLVYEGLENFRRLNHLIYLSFRNVKKFDDFCLDRICGEQFEHLKILDLSGTNVSANGLIAVPKLPALEAIVLDLSNRSVEFQLSCSLLQEVRPNLKILDSADVHDDIPSELIDDSTKTV